MPEASTLEWVTPEQETHLAGLVPAWQRWLASELDQYWPEWQAATVEERVTFVDQILATYVQPDAAETGVGDGTLSAPQLGDAPLDELAAEDDAATLTWASVEQRAALDALAPTRGEWHLWLPSELDTAWPDWRQATGEVLRPWLDALIPLLISPSAAGPVPDGDEGEQPGSVDQVPRVGQGDQVAQWDHVEADLEWVTAAQVAQLDALSEERGDWHVWLPAELDAIGEWRASAAEQLAPWLDQIIPTLGAAAQSGSADPGLVTHESIGTEVGDAEVGGAMHDAVQDDIQGLTAAHEAQLDPAAQELAATLSEALASDVEMAQIAASLTSQELADILSDALALTGGDGRSHGND